MEEIDTGNLILTRREGETIVINDNIKITVSKIVASRGGAQIHLAIKAPKTMSVHRQEIWDKIQSQEHNGNIK